MFHENPEKPGVRALARLAFGELFALCQLNVVFLLTCLPVVTIGPAWTALTRATLNMVWQRSSHPVREYLQALRENFRGGLGLGLLLGGAAAAAGAACLVYARLAPGQPLFWLLLVVAAALATEVLLVSTYAFPLLAGVQLPFRAVLWDALLLTLACPHHAIPAAGGRRRGGARAGMRHRVPVHRAAGGARGWQPVQSDFDLCRLAGHPAADFASNRGRKIKLLLKYRGKFGNLFRMCHTLKKLSFSKAKKTRGSFYEQEIVHHVPCGKYGTFSYSLRRRKRYHNR